MRRRMVLIAVPLALALVLVAALWWFQDRLIYFPGSEVEPIDAVLPGWSEVRVTTTDGLNLAAWWSAPEPDAAVVVVLHGNAGTRADRAPLGARLAAEGLGVLLVDYRGFGGNPGRPSESGLALDARAAARFVSDEAPGHPVVLFGESLGAAVAIELATADAPAALVLRSPFTSLADVARVHYPLVPVGLLLRDDYPSDTRIGSVRAPVLVIAGSSDSVVPTGQSRRLYELAPEPKDLVIVAGADHNDFELLAGDRMVEAILRFIGEATGA